MSAGITDDDTFKILTSAGVERDAIKYGYFGSVQKQCRIRAPTFA